MPSKHERLARRIADLALLVLALGFALPLLPGCGAGGDFRPEAVGPEGRITVVIDSARWDGPLGLALRQQLGDTIATLPAPEPAFQIRRVGLGSQGQFDELQKEKNLVFVAPIDDSTNVARFLRSVFAPEAQEAIRGGNSAVIARRDVWRRKQQVFYLTASDENNLVAAIRADGRALRDTFNVVTRQRLYREMFDRGRQPEIEEQLMQTHGFAVNVQHDYQIANDTTNFVWLRRVLADSWRSLFIYYEENADPSTLTPEWIYATRDSLTKRYLQGTVEGYRVIIDYRRPLESEEIDFEGRYAYETRGLWVMARPAEDGRILVDGGGPFLTYAFYDQASGRIYLIDGMVFAPGHDKREFLRHMEVIAHTFRTSQEAVATARS